MNWTWAASLGALLLTTPATALEDADGSLAKINAEIRRKLQTKLDLKVLDGPATRFRSVNLQEGTVCGLLNTKNKLGAYTGYQKFAFEPELDWLDIGSIEFEARMVEIMCPDLKQ
jgi:hypothetical protein